MTKIPNFENIEKFYYVYEDYLLRDDRYRPCKSVTRDVEATIDKFVSYFGVNKNIVSKAQILLFFNTDELNDTHNTNIRTMREFGLIKMVGDGSFEFTKKYFDLISENGTSGLFVLNELYKIKGLQTINMYTNTLLCTLREGYSNGYIVGFPDSFQKFKEVINSEEERFQYRQMVYKFYGFSGRGKTIYDDEYTPNANYRALTELKKLNLIKECGEINDKLPKYKLTSNALHLLNAIENNLNEQEKTDSVHKVKYEGFNKIYYGIPGCGKSYKISAMLSYKEKFQEEANRNGIYAPVKSENIFRTTFYLDYSNSDFIGQIYPKVERDEQGKQIVTYKNVPGPFTKALTRAYENPSEMIYLVIEEINRGNAAAIFGDTFQLLDRLKSDNGDYKIGDSEYPITNEFIEGYLRDLNEEKKSNQEEEIKFIAGKIYIPRNLTILATMNTSDQNVFPLDTAFKRRWDKERVVGNWKDCSFANKFIPYTEITWEKFATDINTTIVKNTENGIMTEDKKMGCFFATEDMFTDEPNTKDSVKLARFVNNVVDYLFNDVSKFDHSVLFNKDLKSFDDIDEKVEEVKDETKKFVVLFNKQLGFVQVNVEQVEVVDNNE